MSATMRTGKAVVWAAVWLLLVAVAAPALGAQDGKAEAAEPDTLHIAVIGASVSGGFGAGVTLAEVLEAAVESPKTVTDLADVLFFMGTVDRAAKAIKTLTEGETMTGTVDVGDGPQEVVFTAEKDPPDVVIGIDFLFWFAYGDKSADARKADLQKGFEFLEQLDCPILIGDLPTYEASFMLDADQIPSDDELEALNTAITAWAKKHENVTVYPVAALVESIRNGEAVEINGEKQVLKADEIFAMDKLHVTTKGLIAVTVMILETLSQEGGPLANVQLILDPDRLAEKLTPEEATVPAEQEN